MLMLTDVFDGGRRAARFLVPPLAPRRTARAAYRVPTDRRGRYRIGPIALTVTDPFGLARRTLARRRTSTRSDRAHASHEHPLPRQAGGAAASAPTTVQVSHALAVDGEEFLTLREYEVGDDLRRVHWRSTARHRASSWSARTRRSGAPAVLVLLDTAAAGARPGVVRGRGRGDGVVVDRLERERAAASRCARPTARTLGARPGAGTARVG